MDKGIMQMSDEQFAKCMQIQAARCSMAPEDLRMQKVHSAEDLLTMIERFDLLHKTLQAFAQGKMDSEAPEAPIKVKAEVVRSQKSLEDF